MVEKYWYLLAGITLGWLTKIPFMLKYYRSIKADKEHINEIVENYKRHYPPADNKPSN